MSNHLDETIKLRKKTSSPNNFMLNNWVYNLKTQLKDFPQPQFPLELGLLNLNPLSSKESI